MMKKRNILHWAMGVVMTPLLGSCAFDELHGIAGEDNVLSFGVEVNAGAPEVKPMGGATRSGDRADSSATGSAVMSPDVEGFFPTSSVELSSVDGKTLYANCDERSGINMHNNVDYKITRGTIRNNGNFYDSFALYGYVYDSDQTLSNSTSVDTKMNGIEMIKGTGTDYNAASVYWPGASKKATFFAVAPKDCSGASITADSGDPQITYTVPQEVSSQEDLLLAVKKDVTCDGKHAPNPLTFNHALAAIKFEKGELGDFTSISKVEISGVKNKGTLSSFETPSWREQTIDGSTNTYSITSLSESDVMFLMPQTTPDGAKLKVTFKNETEEKAFEADLKGTSWEAGHQYTYSLSVNKVTGTFKFEVSQSTANVSTSGGDVTYTVKSVFDYSTGDNSVKIPWQATYSLDSSETTTIRGNGGDPSKETLSDATFTIPVPASETTKTHKDELKSRAVKGTSSAPFDLSTEYNGKVNTANCYVITSPGVYKLPLVYGNAVKNGSYNTKAYASQTFVDHNNSHIAQPYIYTSYAPAQATLLWQDATNLVTNCRLINDNKYLQFEVSPENIDQGNAVIAVQNSSGTTLWSWHIWVTDHAYRSTIAVKNKTKQIANFMPVPLGWRDPSGSTGASKEYTVNFSQTPSGGSSLVKTISQVASLNTAGNATFYQWGRKDPQRWGNGLETMTETTKGESIQHPEKFITTASVSSNIWDTNPTYDNWNANVTGTGPKEAFNDNAVEKTVYDPSPVGFKMPTTNAFTGFTSENLEERLDSGIKFKTGLSSPNPTSIYFRTSGTRSPSDGWLDGSGTNTYGYYWASGPFTLYHGCLFIFLNWSDPVLTPTTYAERAKGSWVRPVSE